MAVSLELVRNLAGRLADDLRTAGPTFSAAAVEADLGSPQHLQDIAAALGLPAVGFGPHAVSVSVEGRVVMQVRFLLDVDINGQLVDALSQVQDVVAEETTEQWPACPRHRRHPLEPVAHK
jgi:hypothetical protein